MKYLLLILPLAACVPHVDPCLRPIVENPLCVETDRADRPLVRSDVPDYTGDGHGHHDGSSDDNGDVSRSSDSNGDGSD